MYIYIYIYLTINIVNMCWFSCAVTMFVLVLTTKIPAITVASTPSGNAPEAGELIGTEDPLLLLEHGTHCETT